MDEPDWAHRNSDILVWQLPGEEVEAPKKKKKPILHPAAGAAIIISALLTGTVFGTVMIRAVDLPEEKQTAAAIVSETPVQETKKGQVSLFIIQGGLFSTKAAAEKASAEKKIPAAIIPMDGRFSLVYGAFLSQSEADEAERKLELSGLSAYVKQIKAAMTEQEKTLFTNKTGNKKKLESLLTILSP